MEKQNIKFRFLELQNFFTHEATCEIDENRLICEIREINPQITFMVICHGEINDLKFLLEEKGLFAEQRINRDLTILSNGQILKMNEVQRKFIQKMAHEDHVEKDVIVAGPVGSGKTLLGLEAINIKKSHYKMKHGISPSDCKNKLRVIILLGSEGNMLKQQLEKSESYNDCTVDIQAEYQHSDKLTRIFKANKNYKSFSHTLIMVDEIVR